MSLDAIIDDSRLPITRYEPVQHGDISRAFRLYTHDTSYFMKVNDAEAFPQMFEKEVTELQELHRTATVNVPQPIMQGEAEGKQYLILEWIPPGASAKSGWVDFGHAVAQLHKTAQPYFGFKEDNYIGSLYQTNTRHETWHQFYSECRIMPLAKILFEVAAFTKQDLKNAERLCETLDQRFPSEPPAILHGDLWSGNYLFNNKGHVVLFDPATYYGHREMDIGMSLIFGGFDDKFYDAYNEAYPLEKGWRDRVLLTQLYPLLVHAVLFGGYYVERSRSTLASA